MLYRSETAQDPTKIVINDAGFVDGQQLQQDVKHLAALLVKDNSKQRPPLTVESFVVAIQGGWGTGKTWASWAFINYLKEQKGFKDSGKLHIFPFELLPFSNINESVGNILGSIGQRLWQHGVVDVRKEFSQMAIDATPDQDMKAGVSVLGLSLSKTLTVTSRYKDNKVALRRKFSRLTEQGYRFVLMLDDLDRMKPNEVLVVIRMVENFRDIPGIIFVLPFSRKAIVDAIPQALALDEASAHVYLRKFIKASITIELRIENLKKTFEREFDYGEGAESNSKIHARFGMNTGELAWYVLMNAIILRETIDAIGTDTTAGTVSANYNNNEASSYLFNLAQMLGKARSPGTNPGLSSLPYAADGKWKRFAEVYGYLSNPEENAYSTVSQLGDLMSEETLTNSIYRDPNLVEELRSLAEKDYDETVAGGLDQVTVFEEILLPHLQETANEPKLTQNYSRRDMEQLAKAICNDPDFKIIDQEVDFLKNLISITRRRFLEFR